MDARQAQRELSTLKTPTAPDRETTRLKSISKVGSSISTITVTQSDYDTTLQ